MCKPKGFFAKASKKRRLRTTSKQLKNLLAGGLTDEDDKASKVPQETLPR